MTTSKRKVFYFIIPIKQSGIVDLTAWTCNKCIAESYCRQWIKLEPAIIEFETTQDSTISSPHVQNFVEENFDSYMGDDDEIHTWDITPFECNVSHVKNTSPLSIVHSSHESFLFTISQETAIFDGWYRIEGQIIDMLIHSFNTLKVISKYVKIDGIGQILEYIWTVYVCRYILSVGTDLTDLTDFYRNKLHLPLKGEQDTLDPSEYVNQSYMITKLILNVEFGDCRG